MTKKVLKSTVKSTMVGPLWVRAKYGALYPEILKDPQAEITIKKIYDMYPNEQEAFAKMEEFSDELVSLYLLFRAKKFDDEIRDFKSVHHSAIIINLGCGLDTPELRVGDNNLKWFQIDLPEIIAFREKLISTIPNSKNIAKSILDYSWFNDLEFDKEKGVLILAAGLFNYFQESQLKDLCDHLANHFPGGTLVFDVPSVLLKKILNKKYKKLGIQGVDHEFGLGNPKTTLKWSNKINAMSCTIFLKGFTLNPKWSKRTRFLMKICRTLKFYKFVKLEFR